MTSRLPFQGRKKDLGRSVGFANNLSAGKARSRSGKFDRASVIKDIWSAYFDGSIADCDRILSSESTLVDPAECCVEGGVSVNGVHDAV